MPLRCGQVLVRRCLLSGLMLAGLLELGCVRMAVLPTADKEIVMPTTQPRPVDRLVVPLQKDPTKTYRIGPRDILRIDVRKDPTLTQPTGYSVTEEGNILLPNVGPVLVSNMTPAEVEQKLNQILAQYIREPDAKVGVQEYRSKSVYVLGQVTKPGPQMMRADMLTLQEAIFAAELPNEEAAIQRCQVITPDMDHPVVRQIDLSDILFKGKMRENILLKPNDIVYVPGKTTTNLSAVIRELLRPANQYYDIEYKANYNNNNNNNNNGGNNNNNNNNNNKWIFGF